MKSSLLVIVVLAAIGTGAFVLTKNEPNSTESTTSGSQTTASSQQATAGGYIDYSSDIIAKTSGTKLLFFHASWCPQCRALEKDIQDKGVPTGVTIIKVDYDSNQSLRQKYGVTIQTTLVRIDDNGGLVKKYVAYDEPNLEAVKQNLL